MKAIYRDDTEIKIYEVRKLEGKDLDGFADWYKPLAYAGKEIHELEKITWQDTPNRKGDGSLSGCNNTIWLITEDQTEKYIALNQDRLDASNAAKKVAEVASTKAVAAIYFTAKTTGKPQVLRTYQSTDCLDNLPDCSFDNVTIWAMPDGTEKQTHNHCF